MDEAEKADGPSAGGEEVDLELAMEAAREVFPEVIRSRGGIELEDGGFYFEDSLTEEEIEQQGEEILKEMNVRGNALYRRKKQEKESSN